MAEMKQMIVNADKSKPYDDGHLKRYLICIKPTLGGEECWDIVQGRTEAYEYIKERIDDINFESSFIVVATQKIDDRKSIIQFMSYIKKYFPEDSFDIND